ncbi:MAG: DinB family protein [Dehalococcoidia bacterium]
MADERLERFKAAFQKEAAASDWQTLHALIAATRDGWADAVNGLREADAPPGPQDGEWSPWHVCNHVAAWLQQAAKALERAAAGESTNLGPNQAWLSDGHAVSGLLAGAAEGWERLLSAVEAAGKSADAAALISHRIFGDLQPSEYTVFSARHMATHVTQMRELRGLAPAER